MVRLLFVACKEYSNVFWEMWLFDSVCFTLGEHILAFAACVGNQDIISMVINAGASTRAQDSTGMKCSSFFSSSSPSSLFSLFSSLISPSLPPR